MGEWQPVQILPVKMMQKHGHTPDVAARIARGAGKIVRVRPAKKICPRCKGRGFLVLPEDAQKIDPTWGIYGMALICENEFLAD